MTAAIRLPATVEEILRLGAGFSASERTGLVGQLARLDSRLKSFPADASELVVSVKDRDGKAQRLTLECHLPHRPTLVATSDQEKLDRALVEARDELIRQLADLKAKRVSRGSRTRRATP